MKKYFLDLVELLHDVTAKHPAEWDFSITENKFHVNAHWPEEDIEMIWTQKSSQKAVEKESV